MKKKLLIISKIRITLFNLLHKFYQNFIFLLKIFNLKKMDNPKTWFDNYKLGGLTLKNRMLMAPLTRIFNRKMKF